MRGGRPGSLLLLGIGGDALHLVDAPAEIGAVGRVVRAGAELLPSTGLGVVDVVGAGEDREAAGVADDRGVVGLGVGADIAPPRDHRAGTGEELAEAGGVGIGVDLIRRLARQRVDHVLDGAHPGGNVDTRLHGVGVEQPGLIVGMLGIGGGAAAEEIEAEAAPGLWCIEVAVDVGALVLLALEELGDGLHLLPGDRNAPLVEALLVGFRIPGLAQGGIGEDVGAVVEVVGVAVDGYAVLLAVPGADRRLQVGHDVVHVDLGLDPVVHLGGDALAADVALEGGT